MSALGTGTHLRQPSPSASSLAFRLRKLTFRGLLNRFFRALQRNRFFGTGNRSVSTAPTVSSASQRPNSRAFWSSITTVQVLRRGLRYTRRRVCLELRGSGLEHERFCGLKLRRSSRLESSLVGEVRARTLTMRRTPGSGGSAFRFLPAEVVAMEKALDDAAGATPARSVVDRLAEQFTNSPERAGQKPVAWKQVWNWFQNRRHAQKAKIEKSRAVASEAGPPAPRVATLAGTSAPKKVDVQMDFEAKSARDGAWYDVSAFIDSRNLQDELAEVKVRFAGFGSEEDEWVNIKNAVRQRSLPCETTECVAVLPGDLILCFQEGSEQALYFDADILDVQRRRHDVRGCRCRFWVRYRHDQTEEVVPLRKVCRRPETEQRLQLAREGSGANIKLAKDINLEVMRSLGTPNIRTPSQIPPTTPATPAQPSSAFNATHNLYTATPSNPYTPAQQGIRLTPGLQPMQPIPIQPMYTPDSKPDARPSSIHQQAVSSSAGVIHSTSTGQRAAVSSSQGPALSTPIGTQSFTAQLATTLASAQQGLPSIESSMTRQLNISAPIRQAPPSNSEVETTAGIPVVKPTVSGVPEQPTVASTGAAEPINLSQPMSTLEIAEPSVPGPANVASTRAAEPSNLSLPMATLEIAQPSAPGPASVAQTAQTSNLAQSMEGVSITRAVDPSAGPSSAAQGGASAEVGLPSGSSAADAPMKEEKFSVTKDLSSTPVAELTRVGDDAAAAAAPVAEPTHVGDAAAAAPVAEPTRVGDDAAATPAPAPESTQSEKLKD